MFGDLGEPSSGYLFFHTQIWIDYYNDFFFDSTDLVHYDTSVTPTDGYSRLFLSLPSTPSNVVPFRMIIPAIAQPGVHRMRVRYFTPTDDTGSYGQYFTPCGKSFWGETHDYTIKIIPRPLDTTSNAVGDFAISKWRVAPNPSGNIFTLSAGGLPPSSPMRLTVTDGSGRLIAHHSVASKDLGGAGFPIDLSARPAGIYFLRIEGEGRVTVVEKLVKL